MAFGLTTYPEEINPALFPGSLATNTRMKDAVIRFNGEASLEIPFGCAVVEHSSYDGRVVLPPDSATLLARFAGISLFDYRYQALRGPNKGQKPKADMSILRVGPVWVKPEGAITVGGDVYIRHTANGGNTQLGAFAGAAGTGLTKVRGLFWETGLMGAENLAVVNIHIPLFMGLRGVTGY